MIDAAAQITNPLIYRHLFNQKAVDELTWEFFRPGIFISRIYSAEHGPSLALLKYEPGASLGRHVHAGYEHIFVLHGSQSDDNGEHLAGTLLIHAAGTSHKVTSRNGCIVLAYWEKPVQFV